MNRLLALTLLILIAVVAVPQGSKRQKQNPDWKPRLENTPPKETKSKTVSLTAPPESIAALRRFLAFVSKPEPDLMKDKVAQGRLLSRHTRDGIDHLWKAYAKFEKDNPGYDCSPDNDMFMGAWDYPTTYSIIGSRHYDSRVIIDVIYRWGPETNYPGSERLVSYVLVAEDGGWKLDDMYTFHSENREAYSLTAELWVDIYRC